MPGRRLRLISPVKREHPLNRGLSYWGLVLPGGAARSGARLTDLLGRYPAALSAGASLSGPRRPGGWGAIDLDNTDDYLDLSAAPLVSSASPFTICWWERVKPSSGTYPSRFRFFNSGGSQELLVFRSSNASYEALWCGLVVSTAGRKVAGAPSLASSVDIWRHWCLVCRSQPGGTTNSDYTVFVDGLSYAASDGGGAVSGSNTTTRIGLDGLGDSPANCLMDDIRVYQRALSDGEAWLAYQQSRLGHPDTLRWENVRKRRGPAAAVSAPAGRVIRGVKYVPTDHPAYYD